MRLMEIPTVKWKTPAGEKEIKMKLWLVQNTQLMGLLEGMNTVPREMPILQNPELRDNDAFLGRSTLINLRMLTDHHAGVLMQPGGLRIKMWKSKKILTQVLAHVKSATARQTAPTDEEAPASASASASTSATDK